MADILQDFHVAAPPERVFAAVSEPGLLDEWWTLRSSGAATAGAAYELDFGPGYQWRAEVTKSVPGVAFELRMAQSDADWRGTLVGFDLTATARGTQVRFHHRGWPEPNEHYRISCHCWALYLRILRRFLEIEPPSRLVYTWNASWDPPGDTVVTYELAAHDAATLVRVTHEGIMAGGDRQGYQAGWGRVLAWLAQWVERGATS